MFICSEMSTAIEAEFDFLNNSLQTIPFLTYHHTLALYVAARSLVAMC